MLNTMKTTGAIGAAAAVRLLTELFQGRTIFLASYANDRADAGKFPPRDKVISDPAAVAKFLDRYNEPGRACYFAVNVMEGKTRGKAHTVTINALHLDIDFSGVRDDRKRIEAALAKAPSPPSAAVFSGHGIHAYWLFDKPVDASQAETVERLLRSLCGVFAGDTSTAEVARVMRIPGSHNSKNGDNIPVTLLEHLTTWKRYSLAQLDRWLEDQPPLLTYKKAKPKDTGCEVIDLNEYQKHARRTRARFDADEALDEMEMHGVEGNGLDATMAKVVGAMVREGFSVDEVIETVLEPVRLVFERDRRPGEVWDPKITISIVKSKYKRFTRKDAERAEAEEDTGTKEAKAKRHLIETSEQFTRGFVPPDYLVDGMILCGFMYALTALTGHCKTAVLLLLSAMVARGHEFADCETKRGRVLYLAGENPDDVRMRWIAMGEHMGFDTNAIDVCFISGTFDIAAMEKKIAAEVEALGGVALVIIDTGPAFFQGDAENDNVDMLAHAKMMRRLISLPGKPTVIAAMHPIKNATKDNLVPRGGGSFLNELDGNLTAWREDTLVTLHHGKLRGAPFEPMPLEWESVTAKGLVDSKGRLMPTVLVRALTPEEQTEHLQVRRSDEDEVLALMLPRKSPISYVQIATELVWTLKNNRGPNKSKAQRIIEKFKKDKLVKSDRDGSWLTKEGSAAAEKVIQKKPHLKVTE